MYKDCWANWIPFCCIVQTIDSTTKQLQVLVNRVQNQFDEEYNSFKWNVKLSD